MSFNKIKFQVQLLSQNNSMHCCRLGEEWLVSCTEKKDLEMLANRQLKHKPGEFWLVVRKKLFSKGMVRHWNVLPGREGGVTNLGGVKKHLDVVLLSMV